MTEITDDWKMSKTDRKCPKTEITKINWKLLKVAEMTENDRWLKNDLNWPKITEIT